MITVVGIFEQPNAAGKAVLDLRILGIEHKNIDLLSPGVSEARLAKVPTADSESPGMAGTMGTVLGGAVGVAGGFSLGVAASFMLPGVGPVLALGSLGAAVLGLAGGIGGHAAGESLDRTLLEGLPKDELFLYEDALRQGRSVVLCLAQTELEADEARRILAREGAESIDAARHRWWLGLLDLVREHYNPPSPETDAHEDPFRQGFEAALNPEFRGKPWDQVVYLLAEQYRDWSDDRFRRGFERGQRFHSELMAQPQHVWVSVISCGDFERHRPTRSCRDRWQSPPFRTNRVARQRSTRKGPHEMIVNGRDAMASRRNFDHSNRRS